MPDFNDFRNNFGNDGMGDGSNPKGPGGPRRGKGMGSINMPKISKGVSIAVLIILLAFFMGGNGFYRVSETEQAVITQFGKVLDIKSAGMYLKIPFIQKVRKVDTTTQGLAIGYRTTGNRSDDYTNQETTQEESESLMITSDFNFVNIDFYLEYRVSDPQKYLYASDRPETILKNLAQASIRSTVSDFPVDDVMTTGKSQVQSEVRDKLTSALAQTNIGIEVVNMTIQDVEPPTAEVISAFKAVENAKQGAETAVNNARKYQSEQIPAAEANADKITQRAEATKAARIAEAEGQVTRFNEMFEQYQLNPLITKQRMFYETMEDVLPDLKVIITDGSTQTMYPVESFTQAQTAGAAENSQEG